MKFQKETCFFIIFESSNAHNFSSNWDGAMEFTALKRENFFLPITSIQLMYHRNKFLNNSTKMTKIEGFCVRFSHYFINCLLHRVSSTKTNNSIVIEIKLSFASNEFQSSTYFSSRAAISWKTLWNREEKNFNQNRLAPATHRIGKRTRIDSIFVT